MDGSFVQWRDSPRDSPRVLPRKSRLSFNGSAYVISDSDDEDIVDNSAKQGLLIDESKEYVSDADVSANTTPTKNRYNIKTSDLKKSMKDLSKRFSSALHSDDSANINEDDSDNEYHTSHELTSNNTISSDSSSDSSTEELSLSRSTSGSPSIHKSRGKKRKDFTHDNTREDIKGLKLNSSNESLNDVDSLQDYNIHKQDNDIDHKTSHLKNESVVINLDSDSHSAGSSESEALLASLAKKEIGVGNIDPLIAQKRALIACKLQQLKNELVSTKQILNEGNIELLPDKGEKLRESALMQEKEIEKLSLELENTPLVQSYENEEIVKKEPRLAEKKPSLIKDITSSDTTTDTDDYSNFDINDIVTRPTTNMEFDNLGEKAQATMNKELALTVERLQDLHGSLIARPSDNEKAKDPRGLKVSLMPHQQHALAWLLWRERQKPSGGVLADDMGLGKTLTMISLIIATLSEDYSSNDEKRNNESDSDDSDSEWTKKKRHNGGTLIICPASLLAQWEKEVRDKCKRGILSVVVYHGSNRENIPSRLAKDDMVITTYNIVARECKTMSTLFKIKWKRVILDEAHLVRNHKSQAAQAVCELMAYKRWALTGTPIQNKELDLYSILKFLKCSPFDDLRVWKRWVDNKNVAGHQRLATLMKTLMLRRTKQELQSQGRLETLPSKSMEEVTVELDSQEKLIYEKILIYSRTLFAQFLSQQAEKKHSLDLYSGKYNKPSFLSNPNKETQFTEAQKQLLAMHANNVKTHEIFVLLLRLRQVCCHPALIHAMLDQEDIKQSGMMTEEHINSKLLRQINNISFNGSENMEDSEDDVGIDRRIVENVLTIQNPVFNDDRVSSKMRALLQTIEEILDKGDDKIIIVSQWATMLDVIASKLRSIKGATFSMFTGKVAIKDRQGIIDSFNNPDSDPRILLLSLTAGGVGLNLIGGNHLILFDIHWNPQLETQAQDRIYRFGQKKDVYIYKLLCTDTIEERIKALQEHKLSIAQSVLSGERSSAASKLTLNDLKSLFGF